MRKRARVRKAQSRRVNKARKNALAGAQAQAAASAWVGSPMMKFGEVENKS